MSGPPLPQHVAGFRRLDRPSRHYGGDAYPNRTGPRVSVQVGIDHWRTWGDLLKQCGAAVSGP
jgi:hypothetical protein